MASSDLRDVRTAVLAWYDAAHRDFSFRGTSDPYAVLVSEVMLQQTQAARVDAAFGPFLARFPTAESLAAATDADVLAAWSGLGYNRRALALRAAAAALPAVVQSAAISGATPSPADLERLPGVGPYTARAMASLAFGQPVGVVDTNVRRWLIRRWGLEPDVPPAALQALADGLAAASPADPSSVAAWTHASMELGAAICRARAPRCDTCPVAAGCPSRERPTRIPIRRQAASTAVRRAARGALLRALAASADHRLTSRRARALLPQLSGTDFAAVVAGLQRDRLLHRSGGRLVLGGG